MLDNKEGFSVVIAESVSVEAIKVVMEADAMHAQYNLVLCIWFFFSQPWDCKILIASEEGF